MKEFKNILCIRADNMGDLIMTSPALRALKDSFDCRITVLTSSAGKIITPFIKEIDETIVADLPWVKTAVPTNVEAYEEVVKQLREKKFDLAIIFTVYSQNPLPAAMLAFEAGIKNTLAYCRENPYHLISLWAKEKEPYEVIKHQVRRDLDLVATIGAATSTENLHLHYSGQAQEPLQHKLQEKGVDAGERYVILHPGVSEEKRRYPFQLWLEIAKLILEKGDVKVLVTGSGGERKLAEELVDATGGKAVSMAGEINIGEMIALVAGAQALISVNTGPVHIAAAVQTPVAVLYALTNPQHTPWQVPAIVLPFSVEEELRSSNQVVEFVNRKMSREYIPPPTPATVLRSLEDLSGGKGCDDEGVLQF